MSGRQYESQSRRHNIIVKLGNIAYKYRKNYMMVSSNMELTHGGKAR